MQKYVEADIEIITFDAEDLITASGGGCCGNCPCNGGEGPSQLSYD